MYSLITIAEEVQRVYKRALGTSDNTKYVIDRRELYPIISQVANELLSLSIKSSISVGDVSIPSHAIATYPYREAKEVDGRYRVDLPYPPLNLPRNMGVWSVCSQICTDPVEGIFYDLKAMIPVGQDDWDLLSSTDVAGLEGETGYYIEGPYIYFTSAPTSTQIGVPAVNKKLVKIKLLVSNPDIYGETDPYPLPPDMITTLVERVLDILKMNTGKQQPEPKPQDR